MTVIDTRKYKTFKYIVIGLLITFDLFLIFLLFQGVKTHGSQLFTSIFYILDVYVIITILLFLILTFPLIKVAPGYIELQYLGLIKINRKVDELNFSYNDKGDGIEIRNKSAQKIVTIYRENTENYNNIISILESKIEKGPSKSKVRWSYLLWGYLGFALWLIYTLQKVI